MTVKDTAIAAIQRLPGDASLRDIEEEIALLHAISEAEDDIKNDAVVANDEMRSRIEGWTSN